MRLTAAGSMVIASALFATMGVCVKFASELYTAGELVMYRGIAGTLGMACWMQARRHSWRTSRAAAHASRSAIGVLSLLLWFYAIGGLPLATGMTLNYTSSVWMAACLLGWAAVQGASAAEWRSLRGRALTVLVGFVGVALILRPAVAGHQWVAGLAGLSSGLFSALAYLQVGALARAGEPESRIVFYFSLACVLVGLAMAMGQGLHAHTPQGVVWLVSIGVLATLAQMALTHAYASGRPMVNASLAYLAVVFSVGFEWWLFNDALDALRLLGIALIIGAGWTAARQRQMSPNHSS